MTYQAEIARILLDSLEVGTLRIRQTGWAGDDRRCAVEADHLHNLPALLREPSAALSSFYWEVENPAFESACGGADAMFQLLWDELRAHVAESSAVVA